MKELVRNLKNDVAAGTPKPVSKTNGTTSTTAKDKTMKGRGEATGDRAMNVGGYSFPFSELQSGEVDFTPLPTPLGLGLNQSLRAIYGNIRHGCVRRFNAAATM